MRGEKNTFSAIHPLLSLKILGATIKTGIIKSNLLAVVAGLSLSLYVNSVNPWNELWDIILALCGSSLIIGAAGAFNNLYDRDIDSLMERTKERPTVIGEVSFRSVLILGLLMTTVGLYALYIAKPLAALFGFLGLFFYVFPYTMWSKRRTIYNTEIGSISGAMPPLIGWTAVSTNITDPAILGLFAMTLIWQMPHFYSIAIRKEEEYRNAKVPMLPVIKGMRRTYKQTNFYLVLLIAASFLFLPVSPVLLGAALLLNICWLVLSILGHRKMDSKKWARTMFLYSLIHITGLFAFVTLFSIVGVFL
ncbi:heme o synthase [Bacillus massilinigeriensis]|uniref:heme o synthase n=1 Tax=Bacillus mediterraneensis TaxID=1805474 RepID=UPI0008F89E7E|nr:heme o synthase [Bacillus mediterraneensis]